MTTYSAEYWIKKLGLLKHPEGGHFRETYRSGEKIEKDALPGRYAGARSLSTGIYYLVASGEASRLHRIQSDEMLHFYSGSPLKVHQFSVSGTYSSVQLGKDGCFQLLIPKGTWFGFIVEEKNTYSLIGCTVSPGFDFNDFEMGDREKLTGHFPDQKDIIAKLT